MARSAWTLVSLSGNLYAVLRKLDADEIFEAYIDWDFPKEGLWETIRERLEKASSK